VRVRSDEDKGSVIRTLCTMDPGARIDPEGNPVTFWITTKLDLLSLFRCESIRRQHGVVDVVKSCAQVTVVKHSFVWQRACSALPTPAALVEVPAGAPVEREGDEWFVKPEVFEDESVRNDAKHYGCRVAPDNVEER